MPSKSKRRLNSYEQKNEGNDKSPVNEDEQEREIQPKSKKARTRGDVLLMKASGQTESERRSLRQKLRSLQRRLVGTEGDDIETVETGAFERVRDENNALFAKVRFTREAVLDGENVELMTGRASKQVENLVAIPRYDATRLAHKLLTKCAFNGGNSVDWSTLGREAGSCFNAVPSRICFYYGPIGIDYEPKVRKQIQRRPKEAEDEEEEESPEELHQKKKTGDNDADNNKLSAVDKHMSVLKNTLKKKCQHEFEKRFHKYQTMEEEDEQKNYAKFLRKSGKETCAIQFLFNPRSFTQTVENIFHFSFLVKHGHASIGMRDSNDKNNDSSHQGPVIQPKTLKSKGDNNQHKQAIVALNMQDWRSLCQKFEVQEGGLPHRKVPKERN